MDRQAGLFSSGVRANIVRLFLSMSWFWLPWLSWLPRIELPFIVGLGLHAVQCPATRAMPHTLYLVLQPLMNGSKCSAAAVLYSRGPVTFMHF